MSLFKFLAIISLIPSVAFADATLKNPATEIPRHYSSAPGQYDFDAVPVEKISDQISRQYIMGADSMIVKWTLKKGAHIPLHFHPNEQITWITSGSVKVLSQDKEYIVRAGDVIIFPKNVPHDFVALEDTIDIDYFTPARQDWLNGQANYIDSIKDK